MLLLLLSTVALAPQAAAAPKPPKERKVCRSEAPTGSRFSAQTCHTKTEWAEIDEANRRNASDTRADRTDTGSVR